MKAYIREVNQISTSTRTRIETMWLIILCIAPLTHQISTSTRTRIETRTVTDCLLYPADAPNQYFH